MSWKETDPVNVWKKSTIVPITSEQAENIRKTQNQPAIQTSGRSPLWQAVSEMRGADQTQYLSLLIKNWPFKWEQRSIEMPIFGASLVNAGAGMFIATKVTQFAFYDHLKLGFWATVKRSNKTPLALGFYTSGVASVGLWHWYVKRPLLVEDEPCASCLLMSSLLVMAISGIALPLVATPFSVHSIAIRDDHIKVQAQNHLERVAMIYQYTKPIYKHIPRIFAIQAVVASALLYMSLWGRRRIFETFDADPDIIRQAVSKPQSDSWANWIKEKLDYMWIRNTTKDTEPLK